MTALYESSAGATEVAIPQPRTGDAASGSRGASGAGPRPRRTDRMPLLKRATIRQRLIAMAGFGVIVLVIVAGMA